MDSQRRRLPPFALMLGLFLATSCSLPKIPATGQSDDILIFADDTTWNVLKGAVRFAFEDSLYTPAPETWFTVERRAFSEWAQNETHKNRIIIGTMDGDGPVSAFVQQSLDTTVRRLVAEGKEFFFVRTDSRARGQTLMFLVAPSARALEVQMRNRAPDLLYYFRKSWLKRELADIEARASYNKDEISRSLLRRNGWTMTIGHDYFVARDTGEARFFWVRRATPEDMERWIFVAWWDSTKPEMMSEEWIRAARDSVTRKWMRTVDDQACVEIAPYHQNVEEVNFLDRYALEIRGNWRFNDKSGGGPFVSYTFYDEPSRRTYMLDGSIFAPRVEKKKLIMQVEALLNTFKTAREVPGAQRAETVEN